LCIHHAAIFTIFNIINLATFIFSKCCLVTRDDLFGGARFITITGGIVTITAAPEWTDEFPANVSERSIVAGIGRCASTGTIIAFDSASAFVTKCLSSYSTTAEISVGITTKSGAIVALATVAANACGGRGLGKACLSACFHSLSPTGYHDRYHKNQRQVHNGEKSDELIVG
jgi:hypothetical protein